MEHLELISNSQNKREDYKVGLKHLDITTSFQKYKIKGSCLVVTVCQPNVMLFALLT